MMDRFFFRKRHFAPTYPDPRVMAYHYWYDHLTGQYALMILERRQVLALLKPSFLLTLIYLLKRMGL